MSVLVFLERREEGVHPMSWEALAAGQELAKELSVPLNAVLAGKRRRRCLESGLTA